MPTFAIDCNKRCAECRGVGASDDGLCMSCTIKAMHGDTMVTPTGIEMRRRYLQAAHANARTLGRGPPNEGNPE